MKLKDLQVLHRTNAPQYSIELQSNKRNINLEREEQALFVSRQKFEGQNSRNIRVLSQGDSRNIWLQL